MHIVYMKTRISRALWVVAAMVLFSMPVSAATPDATQGGQQVRLKHLHVDLTVNADGTYTQITDMVEQLNSAQAVEQAGQIKIPYSASLDDLEILEANTLKQNGQKLPVARSSIFTQDGLISLGGLTSFQDLKTTVAVFPSLEPGDSIEFRSRLTRKKAILPNIFTYTRTFAGEIQSDDVVITLVAPKTYHLNIENPGVAVSTADAPGNSQKWTWIYRSSGVEWPEDGSVDAVSYRPHILVSSASSYQELADAANKQFAGKAEVTPVVRAEAAKITAGARDPSAQAKKIFEWVSRNIRYFSVVLDVGGYLPRKAEDILSSRYGDCKDHAVIVEALLAAQGIPSSTAILTTDSIYELPHVPVLSAFNHAIVFVPTLGVYLDTNSSSASFGALPQVDADKPVLLLGAAQPVSRTPSLTAETNGTHLSTHITVAEDGSASGEDELSAKGSTGIAYGALADELSGTDPVKITKSILLDTGFAGEGTASARRISNDADFRFQLLYELRDFALLDQAGGIRAIAPMEFLGASARSDVSSAPTRTIPYLCSARTDVEELDLTFSSGMSLTVPRGMTASGPNRSYESSYQLRGSTVHVERRYVSRVPRGVCDPSEFPQLRNLQDKILKDLRAEVRYAPMTAAVVPVVRQ